MFTGDSTPNLFDVHLPSQPPHSAGAGTSPSVSSQPSAVSVSVKLNVTAEVSFRPFSCNACRFKADSDFFRAEAAYWKAQYQQAEESGRLLRNEIEALNAKIKQLNDKLFGRKSEKQSGDSDAPLPASEPLPDDPPKRKRGHQKGHPGHGRRNHDHLPVVDEVCDLPEDEKCCPHCRKPFVPGFQSETSEVIEVHVRPHVRRIHRRQYLRQCRCLNVPAIITAPAPPKLIPRSIYGDSIFIEVLLDKYLFFRPTHRLIQSLELVGLDLPQGSITDGLQRLLPFFEPVFQTIIQYNQTASHWHADETRWMVFTHIDGKAGYRWYLWVFQASDSVVFILDESRSAKVPKKHFETVEQGTLSVDRYPAYLSAARECNLTLVYCWVHVRRDFIVIAAGYADLKEWAQEWILAIGNLYYLNDMRLKSAPQSLEWDQDQTRLEAAVEDMCRRRDEQLAQNELHPACARALKSLQNHWDGLTEFVADPSLPMDNNSAERQLRGPVVGRKNYYGSGSVWSGMLAAMLFSLFQTLLLWDINPKTWLQHFFRACALNGSKTPDDLSEFLPWTMDETRREVLKLPPPPPDTS